MRLHVGQVVLVLPEQAQKLHKMLADSKLILLTEAVVMIATESPYGAIRGTIVCERLKLPARYLEPELQNLVRAKILKSLRGPKGGYVLAKERRNISLLDIQNAVSKNPERAKQTKFANYINDKLDFINEGLANLTLHEIISEYSQRNGEIANKQKSDFTI